MNESARKFALIDYLFLVLILGIIFSQSLHTINQIGPSWDEPVYFHSVKDYYNWFHSWGYGEAFKRRTLERIFSLGLFTDCNPTLPKFLATISYSLFKNVLGEFSAYRLYAPILFGLLLALIYLRATLSWGRLAGISAVLCTGIMPRLFTDGHIGATEAPLMFFWFLTTIVFEASFKKRWLMLVAGVCYGLAMSVKFTGFLVLIPLLFWALIYHRKNSFYPALCLFLIGPLVFFLLEPSMWDDPFGDFLEFLQFSLFRKDKTEIPVLFLGKLYEFSAPFYYAPFMVMITTPILTLALFLFGLVRAGINRLADEAIASSAIHFLFFMLIMMLPNAPTYDGVRLFDPAFIFLGLLAGYGFAGIISSIKKLRANLFSQVFAMIALIAGASYPLLQVYPYGLEYYNELIGGVSGARERGMETTYWWTVVNKDAINRVNQRVSPNSSLVCWPPAPNICAFYQELGLLRKDIQITRKTDFNYLLYLSRPVWNPEWLFLELGLTTEDMLLVDKQELDGVPLWTLYYQKQGED